MFYIIVFPIGLGVLPDCQGKGNLRARTSRVHITRLFTGLMNRSVTRIRKNDYKD
jgi:hypothetical protein